MQNFNVCSRPLSLESGVIGQGQGPCARQFVSFMFYLDIHYEQWAYSGLKYHPSAKSDRIFSFRSKYAKIGLEWSHVTFYRLKQMAWTSPHVWPVTSQCEGNLVRVKCLVSASVTGPSNQHWDRAQVPMVSTGTMGSSRVKPGYQPHCSHWCSLVTHCAWIPTPLHINT